MPDELLKLLDNIFPAVTSAFGENAILYRLDIGRIYESAKDGDLAIEGQFVDKSDGELFDFSISQESGHVRYKSSGEYLDHHTLQIWVSDDSLPTNPASSTEAGDREPLNLLVQALSNPSSESFQSSFAEKLRTDIDYLGVLSLALFRGAVSVEAQALYAALHAYAIQYAFRGLRLFSQVIRTEDGDIAGDASDQWLEHHGLDAATEVIKEFTSRRMTRFEDQLDVEKPDSMKSINETLDVAIGMAMAASRDMICNILSSSDYKPGDVALALSAAIEEFCPIDNSDGYQFQVNGRELAEDWQQVLEASECKEVLSMQVLGLPISEAMAGHARDRDHTDQAGEAVRSNNNDDSSEPRIYYVNIGEGPSRNWDDCRKYGFLAAGGGRKWSKQLEKIQPGDKVIAYLKGYGYVGIGIVTKASTPSSRFTVDEQLIKELPLINETIRSVKRFSKENGEYLIGVDWSVAVPRENAVWQANAGLYTTALVCASLKNQPATVAFASDSLLSYREVMTNTQPPKEQASRTDWEQFSDSLVEFLMTNSDLNEVEDLQPMARELRSLCPTDLSANDQAKSIQSLVTDSLSDKLNKIIIKLIESGDDVLLIFFIGICDLGDMTDEILEKLLDVVDKGMNLSTLATSYIPHNAFEVNTLVSLIYWPELPDWARAHLVVRNGIGLTQRDRDGVIEYLGASDNLGSDTLISISHDIADDQSKYSADSIEALKAFVVSDFDAVSDFNGSDPDDLASHYNELGSHYIAESKKVLGIA